VEVPKENANQIISVMKTRQIKGNRINMEVSKPK